MIDKAKRTDWYLEGTGGIFLWNAEAVLPSQDKLQGFSTVKGTLESLNKVLSPRDKRLHLSYLSKKELATCLSEIQDHGTPRASSGRPAAWKIQCVK